MSPTDLPTPIRTAAEPSIRWLADVVCYFCGTLESDCMVIQLASGHAALDTTHSVAAEQRWRAGRPLCPRCGGAVFLDESVTPGFNDDEYRALLTANAPRPIETETDLLRLEGQIWDLLAVDERTRKKPISPCSAGW